MIHRLARCNAEDVGAIQYLHDLFTAAASILMMNGTLDAQTPLVYALDAKSHYNGANQHLVVVPGAPHGSIGGEAWSQPSAPCSVQIVEGFVKDPSAPIDESCFTQADPVSFVTDAATTQSLFGLGDPWGDAPVPKPPPPPVKAMKTREAMQAELSGLLRGIRN